jgi:hypothetical protein
MLFTIFCFLVDEIIKVSACSFEITTLKMLSVTLFKHPKRGDFGTENAY